jgi:hypothetical protein
MRTANRIAQVQGLILYRNCYVMRPVSDAHPGPYWHAYMMHLWDSTDKRLSIQALHREHARTALLPCPYCYL